MSSAPLPCPQAFLTSLFTSLPNTPPSDANHPPASNALLNASPATESLFLSLHCLFPNELLPALDLLDRGLVTKLVHPPSANTRAANAANASEPGNGGANDPGSLLEPSEEHPLEAADLPVRTPKNVNEVYYVRSAHSKPRYRSSSSRYATTTAPLDATSYEVRLTAWNCTCAAFAFSAFSSTMSLSDRDDAASSRRQDVGGAGAEGSGRGKGEDEAGTGEASWRFGGLAREREGVAVPVCKHLLACVLAERWTALEGFAERKDVEEREMAGWGAGWGG